MAVGEIFTAPVEHIASGGAGILSFQGKRIFMDLSAPGDTVTGRITLENRHWARAELVELSTASPLRAEPACPLYGICGGCSLQHLNYETQLAEKTLILRDAFTRLGGIPLPNEIPLIPSPPWEYRNRIQLHRIPNRKGGNALGFKARKSDAIIPITDCPVSDPELRAVLREASAQPPSGQDRFTLYSRGNTLVSEGSIRGKTQRRGTVILRGKEIRMDAGVFFQSNGAMLERLIDDLLSIAAEADTGLPMADLYCGVGTFAAFLGKQFPRADLVEENPEAIVLARENTRGMETRLFAQTGDLWVQGCSMDTRYGFMVADPPRQGLSPALRRALAQKGPPVLAYVSCDPATLARDSGELLAGGYRLDSLTGYDFYPQTAHIESLAVFTR
ncbi:class I SAM-dependent RNA methyltransferase [Treponema primitia]|uniref:class I SAM-dependent RNA methyltransferase n=1 Tax=Treponema primitia TaxID=88058 RepID=UPI0002555486|nr:class I SAM-dependent RNA methyltransferase [Treponema primitia]